MKLKSDVCKICNNYGYLYCICNEDNVNEYICRDCLMDNMDKYDVEKKQAIEFYRPKKVKI